MCDDSDHVVCKANPVGYIPPRVGKSKQCTHDNARTVATGETVKIKGVEKKVHLSICDDCGYEKRIVV